MHIGKDYVNLTKPAMDSKISTFLYISCLLVIFIANCCSGKPSILSDNSNELQLQPDVPVENVEHAKRFSPHLRYGKEIAPHVRYGRVAAPHVRYGRELAPNVRYGKELAPHVRYGKELTPHVRYGKELAPHVRYGKELAPHVRYGKELAPHVRYGKELAPHVGYGKEVVSTGYGEEEESKAEPKVNEKDFVLFIKPSDESEELSEDEIDLNNSHLDMLAKNEYLSDLMESIKLMREKLRQGSTRSLHKRLAFKKIIDE